MLISLNVFRVIRVTMREKWRYRLPLTFFGLGPKYMQGVYEQFFLLKYHGGWSFIEAYNLPIGLRNWFVERLAKQFEDEKKQAEDAQRKSKSRRR